MKRKYTKQELKAIRDFLENYDLGWEKELYIIAKKTLKDIGNGKTKT